MADYEFIKYEQDGNIVTITINRPERMNSIHPPTTAELADAWNTFANDDSAWVGILTGAGVDPIRVVPSGRGEFIPVELADTPEARAKNRRTEIILSPDLEELFEIVSGK